MFPLRPALADVTHTGRTRIKSDYIQVDTTEFAKFLDIARDKCYLTIVPPAASNHYL